MNFGTPPSTTQSPEEHTLCDPPSQLPRSEMPENFSPSTPHVTHDPHLSPVVTRLASEFHGVHHSSTITRCVDAAKHGAQDVTGRATPDLVERIARQHLQVLALAISEQR